jgi:hypothetical protein
MPAIRYGVGAYKRDNGNLPEFKLVNLFVEQTPSAEAGVTLLSRPGLQEVANWGAGPVVGLFCQDGSFGGDLFAILGNTLYREGDQIGALTGSGPVSWAASADELLIARGSTSYSYDGTDLVNSGFTGLFSNEVTAVAYLAGLFIALEAGSHRFFWSAVRDSRSWDVLDFASAENAPDELRDVKAVGDSLYLMGQASIEVWAATGAAEIPFSRIQQRLYRKGVIATGCAVEQDNSLTFVGHDGIVYRIAEVPERISDHGIEERIEGSNSVSCWGFVYEGHNFFCLRLDQGTWAFDAATKQWCELATYGQDNFRASCAATQRRTVILGDDSTGQLWGLGGFLDGTEPLVREFTGAFPVKGAIHVDNLEVESNSGWTDELAGQGSDPVLEMRSSRDSGATWGHYRSASLGRQGEYRTRTRYRALGMFDAPVAVFGFRCSDPVPLRVSSVKVNEPGGGRAR